MTVPARIVVLDEVESPPPEHLECDVIDQSITLCGNLTRDVDYNAKGVPRTRMRLAHNTRRLDATTNEWKDGEVLFIDVVCWRSLATNVALSVRKGDSVMVTGRLRESAWTDKEGNAHQRMEIDADVVAVDLRRGGAIKLPKLNRDALPASEFDAAVPTEPTDLADPLDELDPEQASSVAVDAINELRQRASSERSAELVGAGSEPPF